MRDFLNDTVGELIWALALTWDHLSSDDEYLVEGYKTLTGNGRKTTYMYEFIYNVE